MQAENKMTKSKVDLEPKDFAKQQLTFNDTGKTKTKMMMSSEMDVKDIVGKIEKGMRRFGFTAGQFSMSDLIEYILNQTGPADLYISTWAASSAGLKKTFEFLNNGMLRNLKFMIDAGAKQYRDNQFGDLLDKFGDCIRTTRIHAKFFVIRNENWDIVVRTSANLNRNLRLENFEIDENKDFADFFQKFFDEAFKQIAVNENHQLRSSQKLKNVLSVAGGELSVDDRIKIAYKNGNKNGKQADTHGRTYRQVYDEFGHNAMLQECQNKNTWGVK